MADFDERYEDVLQNIEFGIVRVYQTRRSLLDSDVDRALEKLLREYQSELRGRASPSVASSPAAQAVYDSVRPLCEWRLGRDTLVDDTGERVDTDMQPITLEEIVACLKRIRKSVALWTKERGRQGYLGFITQFIQ